MNRFFIKEEIKKIYQSKYIFVLSILFCVSVILPAIFLSKQNLNESILFYAYNIYAGNMKLFWPVISVILYSWVIGHEFSYKTIYPILKSKLEWNHFIFGKFLSASIVLACIFLIVNLFYLFFLMQTTNINNIYSGYLNMHFSEFIINYIVVTVYSLFFLFCLGIISVCITLLTKQWIFSVITMIICIILLPNLGVSQDLLDFTLLKGFYIPQLLYSFEYDIVYLIRNILVYVAYMLVFIYISFQMKKVISK